MKILRFFQETWGYQCGKTNQDNSSFFVSILKVARHSQVTPTQPLRNPGKIPWPEAPLPASWRFPTAASQTWRRVFESVQIRTMGLFKAIFYFPNGKSTIWGIYSEHLLFFGDPFQQIQGTIGKSQQPQRPVISAGVTSVEVPSSLLLWEPLATSSCSVCTLVSCPLWSSSPMWRNWWTWVQCSHFGQALLPPWA